MTDRYFDQYRTVEEIKKAYRELAMQWHPDRPGGDTRTMQEINSQCQAALKRAHGSTTKGDDGRDRTYAYDKSIEQAIIDKISELIAARVPNTATVYLIGTWIWIVGDTKPIKETLKALNCRWHAKRLCWYWHPHHQGHRYNSRAGLDDLARHYGARKVAATDDGKLFA